jgi:hypothetical protein
MLRSRPVALSPHGGVELSTKSTNIRPRKIKKNNDFARKQQQVVTLVLAFFTIFVGSLFFLSHRRERVGNLNESSDTSLRTHRHSYTERTKQILELPKDSIYNLQFPSIDGEMIPLSQFIGHTSLVINVASE